MNKAMAIKQNFETWRCKPRTTHTKSSLDRHWWSMLDEWWSYMGLLNHWIPQMMPDATKKYVERQKSCSDMEEHAKVEREEVLAPLRLNQASRQTQDSFV